MYSTHKRYTLGHCFSFISIAQCSSKRFLKSLRLVPGPLWLGRGSDLISCLLALNMRTGPLWLGQFGHHHSSCQGAHWFVPTLQVKLVNCGGFLTWYPACLLLTWEQVSLRCILRKWLGRIPLTSAGVGLVTSSCTGSCVINRSMCIPWVCS